MLHFLHRIFVQGNNKLIKCILIEFSVNCFYFECIQTFKFEECFFVLHTGGPTNIILPIAYYFVLEAISLFEADPSKICIDKENAVWVGSNNWMDASIGSFKRWT